METNHQCGMYPVFIHQSGSMNHLSVSRSTSGKDRTSYSHRSANRGTGHCTKCLSVYVRGRPRKKEKLALKGGTTKVKSVTKGIWKGTDLSAITTVKKGWGWGKRRVTLGLSYTPFEQLPLLSTVLYPQTPGQETTVAETLGKE